MRILKALRRKPVPDESAETPKGSPTRRLFTTNRYPVYYMSTTKCGCTFLKNLFYLLDHDEPHPDAVNIHAYPDDLLRATEVPLDTVCESAHAFMVVRDPVDRFFSLYFDKIYRNGPQNFPRIREVLVAQEGLDIRPGIDAGRHRQNCLIMIDWLARNHAGETDMPVNPHWRRQAARIRQGRKMHLTHLTLDGLEWQLPMLLEDVIPDIVGKMAAVTARNRTAPPVAKSDILDEALRDRIIAVYRADRKAHVAASKYWDGLRNAGDADRS